jgi:hypothetical protein
LKKLVLSLMVAFSMDAYSSEADLQKVIALQQAQIDDLQRIINKSIICNSGESKCQWIGSPINLRGPEGPNGPQGAMGVEGKVGPQGPVGPAGNSFLTWRRGNNGTVTCDDYCRRSNETCVSAYVGKGEGITSATTCGRVADGPTVCLCATP